MNTIIKIINIIPRITLVLMNFFEVQRFMTPMIASSLIKISFHFVQDLLPWNQISVLLKDRCIRNVISRSMSFDGHKTNDIEFHNKFYFPVSLSVNFKFAAY
jgi:hypothetical protein